MHNDLFGQFGSPIVDNDNTTQLHTERHNNNNISMLINSACTFIALLAQLIYYFGPKSLWHVDSSRLPYSVFGAYEASSEAAVGVTMIRAMFWQSRP